MMTKKRVAYSLQIAALTLAMSFTAFGQVSLNPIKTKDTGVTIEGRTNHLSKPIVIQIENNKRKCYFDQMATDKDGNFKFQVGLGQNEDYKGYVLIEGERENFSFKTEQAKVPQETLFTNEQKIEQVFLELLNDMEKEQAITFKQALAHNHGKDNHNREMIQAKYKEETNLMYATDYAGNIIGSVASGYNPLTYKDGIYINKLIASQKETGLFEVRNEGSQATQTAWSIIALDMANADYNKEKAIKALLSKQNGKGSFGSIDHTAMCMMALEKHKSLPGVQESIQKAKQYLLENKVAIIQEENACTVATVIQGLVAIGENPLSKEWTVGEQTILSALLSHQKQGKFNGIMEIEQSFMALADLIKKESMFTKATISDEGYKQPFKEVSPNTDTTNPGDSGNVEEKQTVNVSIVGYNKTIINSQIVAIKENESVLDLTKRIVESNGCTITIKSGYVVGIDGENELDKGGFSGWKVKVNGIQIGSGADSYKLNGGETIEWYYVSDYTKDEPGNGPETEMSREIDKIETMLKDEKLSQEEVSKAITQTALKLKEKSQAITSKEEARQILQHTEDVSEIIATISDTVKTPKELEALVEENLKMMQVVEKLLQTIDASGDQEKAEAVVAGNIKTMAETLSKLSDKEKIQKMTLEAIQTTGPILKKLENDNTKAIQEEILKTVHKTVDILSTHKSDSLKTKVGESELRTLLAFRTKSIEQLQGQLKENNIENGQAFESQIKIALPEVKKEQLAVTLPANTMTMLKQHKINEMQIHSKDVVLVINQNTLSKKDYNKSMIVGMERIEHSNIAPLLKKQVPQNSVVMDLNIMVEGQKITAFEHPIQVSMYYAYALEQGEQLEVMYLKDDGSVENMKGSYNPDTKMMTFKTSHFSKYFIRKASIQKASKFSDLKGFEWASKTIEEMAGLGFVNGKKEGKFDPSAPITRAEFVTIANKIMGYKDEVTKNPFTDIQEKDWYYNEVITGYKVGLIKGKENNKFDPQGTISREEMAAIITRMLEQKGHKNTELTPLNDYKDASNIGGWAKNAMNLCIEKGVIKGMPNGKLMPKGKANRAEATVMLYRVYNLMD